VNMDGPHSHGVRRYFLDNALQWLEDFHLDGLRLDAVQEIRDHSATHFLEQLSREVRSLSSRTGRRAVLIAESGRNDPRLVWPVSMGGFGLDAMWGFDFHHALHALLTGERTGYFVDFGAASDLALALEQGFSLVGQYSHFYQTTWGRSPLLPDGSPLGSQPFVRYSQSHDEVGNRPGGRRLSRVTDFEGLKLAASAVLMAPGPAMLFMGEEYGEKHPFHFFVDFDSRKLNGIVRRGRIRDLRELGFAGRSRDPSGEAAFRESVLGWSARRRGRSRVLLEFYKILISLRRALAKAGMGADAGCRAKVLDAGLIRLDRPGRGEACVTGLIHFSTEPTRISRARVLEGHGWRLLLDSASRRWGGAGPAGPEGLETGTLELSPRSARLYVRGDAATALYNGGECLP
jgi:maltooligosyltrehalose trehalohydrolase